MEGHFITVCVHCQMGNGSAFAPSSGGERFIVRFDKSHSKDMGIFGSGQFQNRPVIYALKTNQGLPVFWVLPPGHSANGCGGGTNIWRSLKLGNQQADLDEGQVPLPSELITFSEPDFQF
jgi:hypothetical protein